MSTSTQDLTGSKANKPKAPGALCHECPLYSKPIAPTQGPTNSKVIVVSRSPGYHEAMAGKPFSGPSGKVLDYFLKQNGYDRKDVRVTNVVLCAPPEGKIPKEAIKACSPRLHRELDSADTVIAAGSEAVKEVLGRTSIDSARGYTHERATSNGRIQNIVATNNPALVLRDDSTFPNLRKDFQLALNPRVPVPLSQVEIIDAPEQAKRQIDLIMQNLHRMPVIAADIESRGGISKYLELVSFQLSATGKKAQTYGLHVCTNDDWIDNYLKPLLESTGVRWLWHNGKFDVKGLHSSYDINARVDEDTLLLSYALDERKGVHALEYIVMDELRWPNYEPDSVKSFKKSGVLLNPDELYFYAGLDAGGTRLVFDIFQERAIQDGVWEDPYRNTLLPASEALIHIEENGIHYNVEKASDIYEEEVRPELNAKTKRMRELSELPLLNPASDKQMGILYYDEWELTHSAQSRPDKARSKDKEAREVIMRGEFKCKADKRRISQDELSDYRSKIIEFVKEHDRWSELDKQANTYLLGMIYKAVQDAWGKIYTDFLLHGTESGRLSSRNPNLQNITRPKEGIPNIRQLFTASPGRSIVNADYSQAELRCIANLSGDRGLNEIYRDTRRSFHKETAAKFYGKDYTGEEYVKSKNINFGIFYGQSAFAFSQMYNMPQREAQDYINLMWATFPTVKEWVKDIHLQLRKVGTFVSPFGRKRRFYLITEENRDHAEKEAVNFMASSPASDFTLHSAIKLVHEVDTRKASIAILVHDSIVADVVEDYVEEYSSIARDIMVATPKDKVGWDIPFAVDIGVGATWGDAK